MDEQDLNKFLKKYSENRHTEEEHQLFIDWVNTAPIEQVQKVLEGYDHDLEVQESRERSGYSELILKIESRLDKILLENKQKGQSIRLWLLYLRKPVIAAAVLLIVTIIGFYSRENHNQKKEGISKTDNRHYKNDILPGGNKAMLILADGAKILLDEADNGVLATQAGIKIRKIGGQVVYEASGQLKSGSEFSYNTITTPCGGQYQVALPDGSKVWLNAASSLRFPASFSGKERKVELTGEAYFEIAKNKNMPFKVISANQSVEVLGTHFNINAYPDEATINTTLLEGRVKVSQLANGNSLRNAAVLRTQLLKPGQEARLKDDIRILNVDAEQAIAWKEGSFIFSKENIESIMRKVSRWYDVEVRYEGNITREEFIGSVSRYERVSELLSVLELTGLVHFKIEGRRITVMP